MHTFFVEKKLNKSSRIVEVTSVVGRIHTKEIILRKISITINIVIINFSNPI